MLPRLLEAFWRELKAANLAHQESEMLLHRLAEVFGHGTLPELEKVELLKELKACGITGILDPLASTGFHARQLVSSGEMKVEAADEVPGFRCWLEVTARPAGQTEWHRFGHGWALWLSWAPHWSAVGEECLRDFQGDVVVILGDELWTGTPGLRNSLAEDWVEVRRWILESPWPRVEEELRVYHRRR